MTVLVYGRARPAVLPFTACWQSERVTLYLAQVQCAAVAETHRTEQASGQLAAQRVGQVIEALALRQPSAWRRAANADTLTGTTSTASEKRPTVPF